MLGLRYDGELAREEAAALLEVIKLAAYDASVDIAAEKGPFAAFDRDRYLEGAFVRRLPARLRDRIARDGIRNSHLLAIAPTGSVSLLAGNVSPGIEPIPALRQRRRVRDGADWREVAAEDWAWSMSGRSPGGTGAFVEAADVAPEAQLSMQAALQRHVDGAISKTLLLPSGADIDRLGALVVRAHREGLKGIAAHRLGSARGSVVIPGCAARQRGGAECDPA
jgi:ribonucleoside-diphosphate reductase alpha chain